MNVLSGIDALFISHPINIRYLTGFMGASPEERESFALFTQNQLFLFTNSLYVEAARTLINPINKPIICVEISKEKPLSKRIAEILKKSHLRLGFEENDLTVAEYAKLTQTLKGITLIPTRDRIEELRKIKREDEIENIRSAAQRTDACFDWITGKIKPGVTEGQIAWEIESFFRKHGAQNAFSPIVAFGKNSSQPHYQTSDVRLKTSDIILLDFGAKVNGYCSDMTRMVFIGKPNDEWKRAYETVLTAQIAALKYLSGFHPVTQGGTLQERSGAVANRIARDIIIEAGLPAYPHSLGHGVGLAIHEQPRLSYKNPSAKASTVSSAESLRAGMVVTVEPGIYVEGSYGIRIEDLVLLKKDGIEILSNSPKILTIL